MSVKTGSSISATRVALGVLTAMTAAVHFALLFPDLVFMLNALGYLVLLGALLLPIRHLAGRRRLVRLVFAGYTALTIAFWLAIGERTPLGYGTTLVEVLLVVLLLMSPGLDADKR